VTGRFDASTMTREQMQQIRAEVREKAKQLQQERVEKRERRQARRDAGGRLSASVRAHILAILDERGTATDDAILEEYGRLLAEGEARDASDDFVRRQRSKLLADGLVAPTGDTAPTRAGRTAKTWRTVDRADVVRPAIRDAWARGIARNGDGAAVLVVRCPYCGHTHYVRWDPAAPEVTDPDCEQGPIRIRVSRSIAAKLEAEP
jgi:hypothetical protein